MRRFFSVLAFCVISSLSFAEWELVTADIFEPADARIVYWTEHGKKFHTHEDCQALNQSDTLVTGSAAEAIDAGKSTVCKFCEKRDSAALEAAQASIDAQAVNQ